MSMLDDKISESGHVDVLVVLKPEKRVRMDGRLSLDVAATQDLQAGIARDLKSAFGTFAGSRETAIAREMRQEIAVKGPDPVAVAPNATAAPRAQAVRYFPHLGVMMGSVDQAGLDQIRRNDKEVAQVALASAPGLIRPEVSLALAGEPPTGRSWGIERLKVPKLWDKGLTGKDILVGHIDTGVDGKHPALKHAVDAFAEFDRLGNQVTGAAAHDTGYHGTHTAGLIAGRAHKGLEFGVAPEASLASAIVIEGGRVEARIVAGLDWCVGQGARIINISLGVPGYDPFFEAIITVLRGRGILPTIAIGNDGPMTSRSPGNYRSVLSVGAIDSFDQIWYRSSSEKFPAPGGYSKPDIIAPGAEVWSSFPNKGMQPLSGTSMATPHIAGLAALLWQHRPEAKLAEIENAILKSASRPAGIATNRGNRGVPDAVAALKLLG